MGRRHKKHSSKGRTHGFMKEKMKQIGEYQQNEKATYGTTTHLQAIQVIRDNVQNI